jgi:hypothetical protein
LKTRPSAGGKSKTPAKPAARQPGNRAKASPAPEAPIGIGYTLYKKGADGSPVRVLASQEFRAGDAVRLMIEPNTDGYLYVFHAENDRDPVMIFPDARLSGGDNRIKAHVPYEVPSSQEADPRFRWFYFDDKPATERLYLVVTRSPLPGVLTAKSLVAHCRANPKDCPWRPSLEDWNKLAAKVDTGVSVSRGEAPGQIQTAVERDAVSRGLGLPPGAPAPSVVKMNTSPKAGMLMTAVDLAHK